MRRHRQVDQQVIVVCGATSAVGRATTLAAIGRGARVAAVATDADALQALAAEADAPHRLEAIAVPARETRLAEGIAFLTTARFGLLHTWVHLTATGGPELRVADAAAAALPQLRRSGGGAFVAVDAEPAVRTAPARLAVVQPESGLADIERDLVGTRDLVSVTRVLRSGLTAPDRVADAVLRAAVRPKGRVVVRGSARRESLRTNLGAIRAPSGQADAASAWSFR